MKRSKRKIYFVEDVAGPRRTVKIAQMLGGLYILRAHDQPAVAFEITLAFELAAISLCCLQVHKLRRMEHAVIAGDLQAFVICVNLFFARLIASS